jgi:hypothetical protein
MADLLIDVFVGHYEVIRPIQDRDAIAIGSDIGISLIVGEAVASAKIRKIDVAAERLRLQLSEIHCVPRRKIKP